MIISELTCLEFVSVVAKHVRLGRITKEKARSTIAMFTQRCDREFLVLPVHSEDFTNARKYIERLDTSLRTADALHSAIARINGCTLVTADKQLAAAAAMLGVEYYFVPYS